MNSLTTAEFNFHGDPEAAAIVMKEMKNLTLVPWEAFFLEGPKVWKWGGYGILVQIP